MFKDLIYLTSLAGHKNALKQLKRVDEKPSSSYLLISDINDFVFKVSKDKTSFKILFIDPPGGPRIEIEKPIKHLHELGIVETIDFIRHYGYIITFTNDISCNGTSEAGPES